MRIKKCKEESLTSFLLLLKEMGVDINVPVQLESYRNQSYDEKSCGCPPLGITGGGMFEVFLTKPLPIFGHNGHFAETGRLAINAIRIERPMREILAKRNRHRLDLSVWNKVLVLDIDVTK